MNVFLDGFETVFFSEKWRFEPVSVLKQKSGCVEENSNSTKHFEKEIWKILSRWYMLTWERKMKFDELFSMFLSLVFANH